MVQPPIQVAMVELIRRLPTASDADKSTVAAILRLRLTKTDEKGVQVSERDKRHRLKEGVQVPTPESACFQYVAFLESTFLEVARTQSLFGGRRLVHERD